MAQTFHKLFPSSTCRQCPLADGGDGTLDVLLSAQKGRVRTAVVKGPLGARVRARWGWFKKFPGLPGPAAVIEMAEASGLKLLRGPNRILDATTEGTGQLIKAVLKARCRSLVIGVGGTASSDGGAGALSALGFRFFDKSGRPLRPTPREMIHLHRVDRSRVDRRLFGLKIFVLCDVTNPLLGNMGSARVYGPQKGATPQDVRFLENVLGRWAKLAPRKVSQRKGAGAAGGLAFGLAGYLGARLMKGGEFILQSVGWKALVQKSQLIVTGEGRIDRTSFSGKVVGAVTRARGSAKVIAVCGSTNLSKRKLMQRRLSDIEVMGPKGLRDPKTELKRATEKLLMRVEPALRSKKSP
jgi:glycerate kinase